MKRSASDMYGSLGSGVQTRSMKKQRVLTGQDKVLVDREIKKIMRAKADKRVCNFSFSDGYVSSTGTSSNILANLTLGDSSINQASGSKLTPLGVTVRWACEAYSVLGNNTEVFGMARILVVQWFGNYAPTVGAVLGNITNGNAPLSYKNWANCADFKILADSQAFTLNIQADGGGGDGYTNSGVLYVPGKKLRPVYLDNSGLIQKNGIWVMAITNSGASPGPNFLWQSQIVFVDDI